MMMMTPIPAASIIGRHVTLNEQAGEGWFAGYAAVTGIIKSVIQPRRATIRTMSFSLTRRWNFRKLAQPLDLASSSGATHTA